MFSAFVRCRYFYSGVAFGLALMVSGCSVDREVRTKQMSDDLDRYVASSSARVSDGRFKGWPFR